MRIAITWSPNPRYLGHDPHETYLNHLVDVISSLRLCCEEFFVYPEFNQKGNLHYHGELIVRDYRKYYRTVIPLMKKKGFVLEKKRVDSKWKEYCQKDSKIMKKVMNPLPVPVTEQTYIFIGRYSRVKLMDRLACAHTLVKEKRTIYDMLLNGTEQPTVSEVEDFRIRHEV